MASAMVHHAGNLALGSPEKSSSARQRLLKPTGGVHVSPSKIPRYASEVQDMQEPNVKAKADVATTEHDFDTTPPRPERWLAVLFAVLGVATRYYRISMGKYVLWDEAHFGKFGSHYLKHTFYFDVHPPLGKMLVGLAGYLAGYDGSFEFQSGSDYPPSVNYVGMRLFLALFSALAVPMAYLTAVQLRLNRSACILVGLMTMADVGFIGIGRLILLDSMLIFFTTATTFYYCLFRNQQAYK